MAAWGNMSMDGSIGYNSADPMDIENVRKQVAEEQAKELQENLARMRLENRTPPQKTRNKNNIPAASKRFGNGSDSEFSKELEEKWTPPQRKNSIETVASDCRRQRSIGDDDDDQSEEIQELLGKGLINQEEAENLQQGQKMQRRLNRAARQFSDSEFQRPPRFDSDGIPVNWSRDSAQLRKSRAQFILVQLKRGDAEYDQIHMEMADAGLDVVQAFRLQNVHLLDRFKAEIDEIYRRRESGIIQPVALEFLLL